MMGGPPKNEEQIILLFLKASGMLFKKWLRLWSDYWYLAAWHVSKERLLIRGGALRKSNSPPMSICLVFINFNKFLDQLQVVWTRLTFQKYTKIIKPKNKIRK